MFLGLDLVISHHHPWVTKHQLSHGNWLPLPVACLQQMCEKLCLPWPSFIPLWILLSTLTTGCVHKLGWLSWLSWCRIMTGLGQLTPHCGWSWSLSLVFSWEACSLPVFVYALSYPWSIQHPLGCTAAPSLTSTSYNTEKSCYKP